MVKGSKIVRQREVAPSPFLQNSERVFWLFVGVTVATMGTFERVISKAATSVSQQQSQLSMSSFTAARSATVPSVATTTTKSSGSTFPEPTGDEFCLPWSQSADEWWTHKPEWEMGMENETHYCFQKIQNVEKRELLVKLYNINFHGDCSQMLTKRVWSSGWNADFMNVIDGFKHAVLNNKPVQMMNTPWHYADPYGAKPDHENFKGMPPACGKSNMFCYFLPISSCPAQEVGDPKPLREGAFYDRKDYQWYYEYATRRQTWLRRKVYEFRTKQNIQQPCTAIHVRRSDVVLHLHNKRQYFPMKDYLKPEFNVQHNIFLMTDDSNAIVEAKHEFPQYNWMYVDRPRFRASEGGFENQFPSRNPVHEVVVLLSIFQLSRQCNQLIHSHSSFASRLIQEMEASGARISKFKIGDPKKVHHDDNAHTINISKAYENIALTTTKTRKR
ncbi:expressed unknown protein [Seminavis robusta]|uniref:Uncharacterized protein n=1 Tax=Seminavis robusta TaxID=568900 RepID=A0A9N8HX08_9STRA|nr:expressed unknown protein [Seminavis robusta]|eukprot:Sro2357_g324600.1 n/a (444) ;mRNA; f:7724-9055